MVIEDIKEGINDTLEDLFCLLALEQDILKRYENMQNSQESTRNINNLHIKGGKHAII